MPRPQIHPAQRLVGYKLWREGRGPKAIWEKLEAEFAGETVSERTVATWIKGFKELKPEETSPDDPFQWHQLERYGLAWETGPYLLGLSFFLSETMTIPLCGASQVMIPALPEFVPTVRQVRWWWRIHLAGAKSGDWPIGELPDAVEMFDVFFLAQRFVYREMAQDILRQPPDMADLDALLVYQPWASADRHEAYLKAVREERVPRLQDRQGDPEYQQIIQLVGPTQRTVLQLAHNMAGDNPHLLLSQRIGRAFDNVQETDLREENSDEG